MSADPTTLLGTIVSLQLAKEDKKAKQQADAEELRREEENKMKEISTTGYTNFTDWDKVERPRVASLYLIIIIYLPLLLTEKIF